MAREPPRAWIWSRWAWHAFRRSSILCPRSARPRLGRWMEKELESPMWCVRCGAPLDPDRERCVRCGATSAAMASAPPFIPNADGIPIQPFGPASYGPPVGAEPYLRPLRLGASQPGQRAVGGLRIVFPQARRHRRAHPTLVAFSTIGVLLVIAGLVGGLLVRGVGIPQLDPLSFGGRPPTFSPLPTATPALSCPIRQADPTAAQQLAEVRMTTGVRDPQSQDFRPVDDVTTFRAGQLAYITFRVASSQPGSVSVAFCTHVRTITGTLDVPAGYASHYGQFSVTLDSTDVGPAVATLNWNGATAASVPFSITT
jgi:hypothetical protein